MNSKSHRADDYWDAAVGFNGRYVLPQTASWTHLVYEHGTGPQIANVVRLAGETDDQAGEAWRKEVEADWGHPVRVIVCSGDNKKIAAARSAALFGG